jgi:hypothetical protein
MKVELNKRDLQLLVQSLEHCLATCHSKEHDSKASCADCDAAKELNKRLKTTLKEMKE